MYSGWIAVDPVIARPERGQNLIADRPGICRCVIDPIEIAKKLDRRSRIGVRRVDRRDIECEEIHRDPAQERNAPTSDMAAAAMAQRAQPPIGISDGHRSDATGCLHDVRGTVANRLTPVNFADLQDFSAETHNWA